MAIFTMKLNQLIEDNYNIGLDNYEIFNEDYRETLNARIIDHYAFHEIGYETVEMFVHQLNHTMRLDMPMFNKMYESTMFEIDPLNTMSLRTVSSTDHESDEESERTQGSTTQNTGTAKSTSSTNSKSRAVNSQFPQDMLGGNEDYATSAADSIGDTDVSSDALDSSTSSQDVNGLSKSKDVSKGHSDTLMSGFTGSQADLIVKYRRALVNVDRMVIDNLSGLFMSVVNSGDTYFNEHPYSRYTIPHLYRPFGMMTW